jgi:hypothetical protein
MRIRHRLLGPSTALALSLGAAPLVACGSLDGNASVAPTLATLSGNIAVAASATPPAGGDIRVAVVWRGLLAGQVDVAEDLPVSALTFPASFQIQLDVPPPTSAMMSGETVVELFEPQLLEAPPTQCMVGVPCVVPEAGPAPVLDFQVAGGEVVAYLDKNGNGKLDLVPTGADNYVDEIIGTNEDLWLVYFQGTLPSPEMLDASGSPTLGYNLYRHNDCSGEVSVSASLPPSQRMLDAGLPGEAGVIGFLDGGPDPDPEDAEIQVPALEAGSDAGSCKTNEFLPITTLYTLTISGQPEGSSLMCEVPQNTIHRDTVEPAGAIPPGGYPTTSTPGFSCQPLPGFEGPTNGSYTMTSCTRPTNGLCQQNVCLVNQYPQPNPIPNGWPCGTYGASGPVPVGGNGAK